MSTQFKKSFVCNNTNLINFKKDEPASLYGSLTPPISLPQSPSFAELAQVSIYINDIKNRIWLNGTVGWFVNFTDIGIVNATFQLLKNGTVIYETTQSISSPPSISTPPVTINNIIHLDHIDTTPSPVPTNITYILRAQADTTNASVSGPITLTASEISRNILE